MLRIVEFFCFVLVIGLLVCSCESKPPKDRPSNEGYQVVIEKKAGSNFSEKIDNKEYDYLPYPVAKIRFRNQGLKEIEGFLIGGYVDNRTKLSVDALAQIEITEFGEQKNYVLVFPLAMDQNVLNISNFRDLMTSGSGIKQTIENWLNNRYGLNNVSSLRWFGTDKASLFLERNWKE